MKDKVFEMKGKVWLYPGESANWHFVNLPKKESALIKELYGSQSRGWGSLPVSVTISTTTWRTSIFPDKHSGGYALPLKASVRAKEHIRERDTITFTVILLSKKK